MISSRVKVIKMSNRKKAHIISFLCIIAAAVLCVLLFRSPIFNPGRIYYDDDLLLKENETYHAIKSVGPPISEGSEGRFSFERFAGSRTINIIHANDGEGLTYTWDVLVEHGKFKIVLVDTQNAKIIETICEGSGKGIANNDNLPAGEYRVKFVGDNATVEGIFSVIQN